MIRISTLALLLALSACGQGGPPSSGPPARADACALLGDAAALFGKDAAAQNDGGLDDMAGYCRVQSANALLTGEVVVYDGGAKSAAERVSEAVTKWDGFTETPLAAVEGLGDEAHIALDLPGYQTQIVFRKGEKVVLISANSGDPKITGEDLARRIAKAAAAAP